MKTNILTSMGLKLGIFSLALAIPALSAQAQKYPGAWKAADEANRLIDNAKAAIENTKIYPSLLEMIDGGIFNESSKPSTNQIKELLDLRQQLSTARSQILKQITNFNRLGDHPVLNELHQKEQALTKALEDLDSRRREIENRGQNIFDRMSDEAREEFEKNLRAAAQKKDALHELLKNSKFKNPKAPEEFGGSNKHFHAEESKKLPKKLVDRPEDNGSSEKFR